MTPREANADLLAEIAALRDSPGIRRDGANCLVGRKPGDEGGSLSEVGGQRPALPPNRRDQWYPRREWPVSPTPHRQNGLVGVAAIRSAGREGSELGSYRKSRFRGVV